MHRDNDIIIIKAVATNPSYVYDILRPLIVLKPSSDMSREIQWNLSIMDTLGPMKIVLNMEVF